MRITLTIDDSLLATATELTGIQDASALMQSGLEALIARESGKRLARLAGTQPKLADVPRRRPASS